MDQETLLLAKVVFIGICYILGDADQALNHAQNNSKLFNSWKFWGRVVGSSSFSSNSSTVNAQSLLTLMTFFECQLTSRKQLFGNEDDFNIASVAQLANLVM